MVTAVTSPFCGGAPRSGPWAMGLAITTVFAPSSSASPPSDLHCLLRVFSGDSLGVAFWVFMGELSGE